MAIEVEAGAQRSAITSNLMPLPFYLFVNMYHHLEGKIVALWLSMPVTVPYCNSLNYVPFYLGCSCVRTPG